MNVTLTGEFAEFVKQKIDSGQFESADAVVCNALTALKNREQAEKEKLNDLRREIAIGIEQAEKGLVHPFEPQKTLERVRQKKSSNREIIT